MREYRLADMNQLGRADLSAEVFAITRLYTQIRYGRVAIDAGRLAARVQKFKPARRAWAGRRLAG